MFGGITGKASPSTAKYIFNLSKCERNLIKLSWKTKLVYIDYKSGARDPR